MIITRIMMRRSIIRSGTIRRAMHVPVMPIYVSYAYPGIRHVIKRLRIIPTGVIITGGTVVHRIPLIILINESPISVIAYRDTTGPSCIMPARAETDHGTSGKYEHFYFHNLITQVSVLDDFLLPFIHYPPIFLKIKFINKKLPEFPKEPREQNNSYFSQKSSQIKDPLQQPCPA